MDLAPRYENAGAYTLEPAGVAQALNEHWSAWSRSRTRWN